VGGRLSHGRLGGDFPHEGGENILSPRRHSRGAEISRDTGGHCMVSTPGGASALVNRLAGGRLTPFSRPITAVTTALLSRICE